MNKKIDNNNPPKKRKKMININKENPVINNLLKIEKKETNIDNIHSIVELKKDMDFKEKIESAKAGGHIDYVMV